MLAISARIELAQKDMEAYTEQAKKIVAPTRKEKGCMLYAISTDINQANIIWINELWETEEDLFAHLATAHIAEFLEFCSGVEMIDLKVDRYEVSSVGPLEF